MLAAPPQPSFTATIFLENKGASSSSSSNTSSSTPQLSPSVVVIIVLITVVFFLSGFLHLLARCFARQSSPGGGLSRRQNSSGSLASQGQLQQLFQQHDAGVEQAFIDALPVFFYRSVRGLKDGADCAVCLNEFSGNDRLRLLPKCSHAFHLECIDEWLLSHSTCPLCRCSLLVVSSDATSASAWAGAVRVESLGRSSRSIVSGGSSSAAASFAADSVVSSAAAAAAANAASGEIFVQELIQQEQQQQEQQQRVVPVKLGRFIPAMVDSPSVPCSRRSYSMGSYEYVLDASGDQTAVLVIAPTPIHRRWKAPGTPGHRSALSECIPEESGSSPWVTIDIDARPMLKPPPQPQLGSILSWTPWKKSSSSTGGDKQSSAAGGGGGGGASAALQAIKSFSFRLHQQQQQQQQASSEEGGDHVWWWKNGGNGSRCLSESEQHHVAGGNGHYGNSSACSQWDQASVCSTNAPSERKSSTGSVASANTTSIARRTLQWLMGRENRQPRASSEDIPGGHSLPQH